MSEININQLPTEQEIELHRGFPRQEEETSLRKNFFQVYKDKLIDHIEKESPDWHPTENQTSLVLSYLYGIYFFNYVVSGELVSEELSLRMKKKSTLKKSQTQDAALSVNDLADWPLAFDALNIMSRKASSNPETSLISLYRDQFWDLLPETEVEYSFKTNNIPFLHKSYRLTLEQDWILAGLEEAAHSYFSYIEREKYGRTENDNGFKSIKIVGPLKDLVDRAELMKQPSSDKKTIDYQALLGDEYAAQIIKSEFVKRYEPKLWSRGYKAFSETVKNKRKKELHKRRATLVQ